MGISLWFALYLGDLLTFPDHTLKQRFIITDALFPKLIFDQIANNIKITRRKCIVQDGALSEIMILFIMQLLGTRNAHNYQNDCSKMGIDTIRFGLHQVFKEIRTIFELIYQKGSP